MHVLDFVVGVVSSMFRFHVERAYAVALFIAGLSLRDICERYLLVYAYL